LDGGKVEIGCQSENACLIQVNTYSEKALRTAKEEHPNVETLTALDVGDDSDKRIII
jgi:hypothetical protein